MSGPIDPLDLPVLARRGNQEPSVERRLRMLLGASLFERDLYELGQSFDASEPEPGDEALLRRVVSAAALPFAQPLSERFSPLAAEGRAEPQAEAACTQPALRLSKLWSRALGLKLGVLLVATLASAAWAYQHFANAPSDSEIQSCEECALIAERHLSQDYAAVIPVLPLISEPAAASNARQALRSRANAPRTQDAAALFRDANVARREGATSSALSMYRELQTSFPNSREAATSHVISARLWLAAKDAEHACREFGAYLKRFPRGELAAEALQGQVTCARQLGAKGLQQRACEQLQERFPNSAYASSLKECGESR